MLRLVLLLLASSSALLARGADSPACETCLAVVGLAAAIGEANASTVADVVALLDDACAAFAGNDTAICDFLANETAEVLLPFLDKQLTTLAWPIARGFCSLFYPVCYSDCCASGTAPEQLHLALTDDAAAMSITWVTLNATAGAGVTWWPAGAPAGPSFAPEASSRTYAFGNWLGVVHTAVMTGLAPGARYTYQVGVAGGALSAAATFATLAADVGGAAGPPLRIIQIGDMGWGNASNVTIDTVAALVDAGEVDLVMHVGDVSYADGYMPAWDLFTNKIERIASRVPYMVGPGNHEIWGDFVAYRTRWSMPGYATIAQNMYYGFDAGPHVHISMTNTESPIDTPDMNATVRAFLAADLAAASASRWKIVGGHRPFYCSDNDKTQCGSFSAILRAQGEAILAAAAVDLVITAHEHGYERSWPLVNGSVVQQNYVDPRAPVHVVQGAGGNREGNERPSGNVPWSVFQSGDVGFAAITVAGGNLTFAFVAANGTALDTWSIIKS